MYLVLERLAMTSFDSCINFYIVCVLILNLTRRSPKDSVAEVSAWRSKKLI